MRSGAARLPGFSTAYVGLDLLRLLRHRTAILAALAAPLLLYLVFGGATSDGDDPDADGRAYTLVGAATWGAALATTWAGVGIAREVAIGWPRLLRLTPMTACGYLLVKALVAAVFAGLPLLLLTVVGLATGVRAPAGAWAASLVIGWLGSAGFVAFGFAIGASARGTPARPDGTARRGRYCAAVRRLAAAGCLLLLLGVFAGVTRPAGVALPAFAEFTPMYGVLHLARCPLTLCDEVAEWGAAAANTLIWFAVFAAAAGYVYRRSTSRQ